MDSYHMHCMFVNVCSCFMNRFQKDSTREGGEYGRFQLSWRELAKKHSFHLFSSLQSPATQDSWWLIPPQTIMRVHEWATQRTITLQTNPSYMHTFTCTAGLSKCTSSGKHATTCTCTSMEVFMYIHNMDREGWVRNILINSCQSHLTKQTTQRQGRTTDLSAS